MNDFFSTDLAYIPISEMVLRLLVAAGLGFLLGLDREIHRKSFGLRTHILLSMATAAFVMILMELCYGFKGPSDLVRIDPGRAIQGVIEAIGLLGAGSIIRSKGNIIGATTGAGIWILGGIGLACGLGLFLHAIIITVFVMIVVAGLHPFDRWVESKKQRLEDQAEEDV